jgi:putative Mg2+ transporter-C (MgtC) family protein
MEFGPNQLTILSHLGVALAAGALIGLERTFHGRPAGFRTHALVCLASALLMLLTIFQSEWGSMLEQDTIRLDPTRMAQGIMTGIGFLGAGVIFKEGLTIRGLTTAASIWITAAIGILLGAGFYFPAIVTTFLTLGVLSAFRWIERKLPSQFYAHYWVKFSRDAVLPLSDVRTMVESLGFTVGDLSYRLTDLGQHFEYRMNLRTTEESAIDGLAEQLRARPEILEFRISPAGN